MSYIQDKLGNMNDNYTFAEEEHNLEQPLKGKVAVVAGATRGAGRAIAIELGAAGATVYCTGRSIRGHASDLNRNETIEDTAEMVTERGGTGIAVRTDHTRAEEVEALFACVSREQGGRLDVLVNDIWGGEHLSHWGTPFWEQPLQDGLLMQERAVYAHLITSYYGAPLMIRRREGLLVEITDGSTYNYRGNLYYSLAKISPIHLADAMAQELSPHGVTALAVTPGFLRSEQMLDHFGVTEKNWQEAAKQEPHFIASETPFLVARAVASLAADPLVREKAGQALTSWDLSDEYGFTDVDGGRPHWGNYAKRLGITIN